MGGFNLGNNNFTQPQQLDTNLQKDTSLGIVAQNIKEKKKRPKMFTITKNNNKAGRNFGDF